MIPRYCEWKETTLDQFLDSPAIKKEWKEITKTRPTYEQLADFYKKHLPMVPGSIEDLIPTLIRSYRKRCGELDEKMTDEEWTENQIELIKKRPQFKYDKVIDKSRKPSNTKKF